MISDYTFLIFPVGIVLIYIIWQIIAGLRYKKKKKKYAHNLQIRDLKVEELERELKRLKEMD